MRYFTYLLAIFLTCMFAASARADAPTNGLVSYWTLAGTYNDSVGTNHGAASGSPVSTNGPLGTAGTAYYFNGVNAYLNCGTGSELNFTSNFTFSTCMWIAENQTGGTYVQLSRGNYGVDGYYLMSGNNATKYLNITFNPSATEASISPPFTQSNWVHVAWVNQIGSKVRIYTNGIAVVTTVDSTACGTSVRPFIISAYDNVGSYKYKGALARIRAYNRALSPSEVTNVYTADMTAPAPTPPTLPNFFTFRMPDGKVLMMPK